MLLNYIYSLSKILEKEMTTHSSILAWRIPWTEDPGGLQSIGLQSRNDWSNWTQLKKIENSHSYKNMYTDIHSRIIHNSINKQLKYPSAEERITQCGIFIQQRILLGNKKEWSMLQRGWHLKALSQSIKATCYMVILFMWNGQKRQKVDMTAGCWREGEKHREGLLTGSLFCGEEVF